MDKNTTRGGSILLHYNKIHKDDSSASDIKIKIENAFYKFMQWLYFLFIYKILYKTDICIKNIRITLDAAVMKDF